MPAVQAKGGTIIALKASSAFPGAKGKAKFQVEGQREAEIEVEHVRRLAGKRVNFFVNAKKVGSARISGLGAAQINRRNSSFPAIKSGTRISVKTAGGTGSSRRLEQGTPTQPCPGSDPGTWLREAVHPKGLGDLQRPQAARARPRRTAPAARRARARCLHPT